MRPTREPPTGCALPGPRFPRNAVPRSAAACWSGWRCLTAQRSETHLRAAPRTPRGLLAAGGDRAQRAAARDLPAAVGIGFLLRDLGMARLARLARPEVPAWF